MAPRQSRTPWWISVVAVAALVGVTAYAWTTVEDREAALADLRAERQALRSQVGALAEERDAVVRELEAALRIGEGLSARVDQLEADLAEANRTRLEVREVRGTADFPIQRAMAEAGDTVSAFAAREGTTDAVVRALNPWLGNTTELDGWQTLWVPKPE
ncbi:hypothetical protein F1188_02260 [Roseospira marina]|uniref:Uncharacterized protein n=1 Tax=Roseospira marina TaxID=140057 RepID=A0A5M6IH40_9PROT|nr:hypothetical protein [Roseospira marina]KAA5607603.1 hypothetical protein F1188_02260 [Roseospira marina]MBB4312202.1 outer membrane murein-binding lipoprotein Lpp [Roseospira marina]MBB5085782.1 outer membrane murein-binding lipoprotein Lpp [Roseospira marina]